MKCRTQSIAAVIAVAGALIAVGPASGQVIEYHAEGGHNWYEVADDFRRMSEFGRVEPDTILEIVEKWGEYCPPGCTLDRNKDQVIDVQDLLLVLSGNPGPVYTIPAGWHIEDGCILVDPNQPRGAFNSARWPGGIVPFEYDDNMDGTMRFRWVAAVNRWQEAANLTFVLRTDEENYIHVQDATFNLSNSIGMAGGRQDIWIGTWSTFTVEHEIAHALGFYHEHTRLDAEPTFVTINDSNICSCCGSSGTADCSGNFNTHGDAGPFGSTDYGPYDFDSVMHYGACFWSTCGTCSDTDPNCRTITVNAPFDTQWQTAIGQRDHLSEVDILSMSFLYPESNWTFVDGSHTNRLEFGTFWEPFDEVAEGVFDVPAGGQVIIQPGTYTEPQLIERAMLLRGPLGGVVIQ